MTYVSDAMKRILATNWKINPSQKSYHINLVQEYIRRAALWATYLKCEKWLFFDVAYEIVPDIRADKEILDKVDNYLKASGLPYGSLIRRICLYNLHWSKLREEKEDVVRDINLPDPYEPMILAYESGADVFYNDNGLSLDITYSGILIRGLESYLQSKPYIIKS